MTGWASVRTLTQARGARAPMGIAGVADAATPLPDSDDVAAFGAAIDALRRKVRQSLGEDDVRYIRRLMRRQRQLEYGGRAALQAGFLLPPLWFAGVGLLAVSKILDNMEIGHNLMHGQYDWAGEPDLRGAEADWNLSCPPEQWRHSHNVVHHRFTNILGVDRDIGYGLLRMSEAQPWKIRYLIQPVAALGLCLGFEWGISLHDLELDRIVDRRGWRWRQYKPALLSVLRKAGREKAKDYLVFPLLAGPFFLPVLVGNLLANTTRNVWAFTIIFCGHFPEGVVVFRPGDCADESRGAWYARQVLGSCNIEGGRWLQLMSGHLTHQIEHHLFPAIPAHRYPELAPEVQLLCRQHGLPYHTGSLRLQFGSVVGRLLRLWLPGDRRGLRAALA